MAVTSHPRSAIHNFPKQTRKPATIGAAVDAAYKLRKSRLQLEKQVDSIKSKEKELREHILVLLNNAKLEGGKGKIATAAIVRRLTYTVNKENWAKFWMWARKDKVGSYIQKRIATEALSEFVEHAKKLPPGVDSMHIVDVSLNKR